MGKMNNNNKLGIVEGLKIFNSDGCTGVPDFNFKGCCVIHDVLYEKGGNAIQRKIADLRMLDCMKRRKSFLKIRYKLIPYLYYYGVRLLSSKWFNWTTQKLKLTDHYHFRWRDK